MARIEATAQTATGMISGVATDETGAAVADVRVIVTNDATALRREITTGAEGTFTLPMLPPGQYTLRAERAGFAAHEVRGITVNDSDPVTLRVQLKVETYSEAVTVTAQRREESAQAVPVAVTVLTGDLLENTRSYDVSSLEALVPSVKLPVTNTQFGQGISIRGMGTTVFSAAVEPSVATFVDGVLIGRSEATAAMQFADVERVEVLRGPQGTLFGKNASSGALLITTREPQRDLHADGSLLLGGDHEYRAAFNITGPLGKRASGRLSTFARGYDGYIRNTYTGERANGLDSWGIRGKIDVALASTVGLKITGEASRSDVDCCAQSFVSIDARLLPYTFGAQVGPQSTEASFDEDNRFITKYRSASAQLRWALARGHELIAITGYRNTYHTEDYDNDRLAGDPAARGSLYRMQDGWETGRVHQVSQEVRLQSPVGGPVDYVSGLYSFAQNERHQYDRRFRDFDLGVPGCVPAAVCSRTSTYDSEIRFRNYAAFGQANWHINSAVTAFLGARLTHDTVSYDYIRNDFDPAPIRGGDLILSQRTTVSNLSVRAGLEHRPAPWLFLYGLYAQGYQGPGFFIGSSVNPALDGPLRPETADAFEAAAKMTFYGGRLLVNVTGYDASYEDRIVNAYDPNQLLNRTFNAAGVRTSGFELDITANPIRPLRLTAAAAYTNARFTAFPNAPCFAGQTIEQGCVANDALGGISIQDLSGKPLNQSPPWRASLAGDYIFPIAALPLNGLVYGNYVWSDKYFFGSGPSDFQGAFGLLNLGVGIGPRSGIWQVRVYADNLTNRFYIDALSASANWVATYLPRDYRRRAGAELRFRF